MKALATPGWLEGRPASQPNALTLIITRWLLVEGVAFSSLGEILGECSTIHSPSALLSGT